MRSLGRAGPPISVLGYGAWITGADTASTSIDSPRLERAIRTALDVGITWIDTAEIYAGGRSEEIVGRAIHHVRDDVVLVTKVAPTGAGSGMRPEDLRRAIHGSLRRLGIDHVDLYVLHWRDDAVPLEETWGAMTQLVDDGLARFVGVSNFARTDIERCLAVGPVHALENQLSLLHRDGEELAGWAAARGIAYLAYGALAFGLLSGIITSDSRFDPSDWRGGAPARYESNYYEELFARGRLERHRQFARELGSLADELELAPSVLALRWVLERAGVTAAVVGTQNTQHLRANARAGHMRLEASVLTRVEDLVVRRLADGSIHEEAGWRTRSASTRD